MSNFIEILWHDHLVTFSEPRLKAELMARWGQDPNIARGRIQFGYPPTFQPGYIGCRFHESAKRLLFIGYNPGEGRLQTSQDEDKALSKQFCAFVEGKLTFMALSAFQAGHLIKWPVYREKGILAEAGDARSALLPKDARPSVQSVALLNLFPFKTMNNKRPFAGDGGSDTSLRACMWEYLVKPTIEALRPNVIVHYPDTDKYVPQLRELSSNPRVIRVWHPSDYNVSARRARLERSWQPLAVELSR